MVKDIDKFKKEMLERNKKRKKGFTLIELLAVFVVLAVVAGVAIFSINNIEEELSAKSYGESVKNVISSAQNYYSSNAETGFPPAGLSVLSDEIEIENKNQYKNGLIIYNSITGKLEAKNITDGNYCANGPIDNLNIVEGECPSTDLACFDYTKASGKVTITGFDFSNNSCLGYVTVPSTIEGLPVTKVGFAAFADTNKITPEACEPNEEFLVPSFTTTGTSSIKITATPLSSTYALEVDDNCVSYTNFYDHTADGEYSCGCSLFNVQGMTVGNSGSKLLGITLPSTITYIDNLAFAKTSLNYINLNSLTELTYIGDSSFKDTNLLSLDFSGLNKLSTIGYAAFNGSSINKLNITNLYNLAIIRSGAFSENNIESLDFTGSNNITHIGTGAFASNQISDIKINNLTKLNSLWYGAFCGNPFTLSSDTLPDTSNLTEVEVSKLVSACLLEN